MNVAITMVKNKSLFDYKMLEHKFYINNINKKLENSGKQAFYLWKFNGMFGSVVAVAFQSIFRVEMY